MVEPQTAAAPSSFRITPQLIVGLLIVFIGVVFTLDELGLVRAATYLKYWPSALIAIGLIKLLQARDGGGAFAGFIFTLAGAWLQLEELNVIHISLRDVWPLALVIFGGYLVWQGLSGRELRRDTPPVAPLQPPEATGNSPWSDGRQSRVTDTNSTMSAMAILGGVSRGNNSSAFRGADLLAIMGGCEIDLRQAAINGEAVIDVFAMWGGIEIRVPEDWTVVSRVVPLMGGVDDKTRPPQAATAHRLVLRGFAIMGGIEIKN